LKDFDFYSKFFIWIGSHETPTLLSWVGVSLYGGISSGEDQDPKNHMVGRKVFIGDVQGCLPELQKLLDRISIADNDQCFFVGDLVNRGPDSLGVLRLFKDLGAISVLGNHEAFLLERGFFENPGQPDSWGTLRTLAQAKDRLELGKIVQHFPILLEVSDILLVHAALPPSLWTASSKRIQAWNGKILETGIKDDEISFLLSARYCDPLGHRPKKDDPPPGPPFRPWDDFYKGKRKVIFGHWARRGLVRKQWVLGLDTGCVYGGKLSAWIQEEDRLVQVPAEKAYWP
jgi:bis(5'-nucleosyl)-tetraphosphatase (symmetrical)